MRIPLPVLAAALVALASGVVVLHISMPSQTAGLFINASALQSEPGQNITLHLNYLPMNITIAMPYAFTRVCIYFHGVVTDSYGEVWSDWYCTWGSYNEILTITFIDADLKDTNVTILVTQVT
ncbi:MAG: hypothetical protein RXO32_11925 [Thermoproteus sp.]